MKILLTVHQFLPDYSSGTEILTYSTARELINLGHDVRIFTGFPARESLADDDRIDEYVYKGINITRFHHAYVPMGKQINITELEYNNKLSANFFRNLIDKFNPDIVHFFHLSRLSASLVKVSEERKIPMVFTATDFWFICPTSQLRLPDNSSCEGPDRFGLNCLRHLVHETQPSDVKSRVNALPNFVIAAIIAACRFGFLRSFWYSSYISALSKRQTFLRQRLNRVDRVLVPTKIMRKILIRNGLLPSNTKFCPYGIDFADAHNPGVPKKRSEESVLRVGFIGTLYVHKGAHVLIEAVRRLDGVNLKLKIYGNLHEFPDYVENLKNLASNDKRIEFLGTFPNNEIDKVFSQIDVLVVPSLWYENTPLVIYSAQAFKCPVIATDLGGMSEAVKHGDNGLLFKKGDAESLSMLIKKIYKEPKLLSKLRKNARTPRTSRDYAMDVLSVYKELLS